MRLVPLATKRIPVGAMESVTSHRQTRSAGHADVGWSGPLSQQDTMTPWSIPSLMLGFYVMQGVIVGSKTNPIEKQSTPISRLPPIRDHLMPSLSHVMERRTDIRKFLPRKRNLNPHRLMTKMGKDFDKFWMSQQLPNDFVQILTKRNVDSSLYSEMSSLGLPNIAQDVFAILESSTYNKNDSNASSFDVHDSAHVMTRVMNNLESWLVQLASCPVYYQWEDLGLIYWPRWVRKGMCSRQEAGNTNHPAKSKSSSSSFSKSSSSSSSSLSSCSWPPGMHCVPAKEKKLKVLRWTCRQINKSRHNGRKKATSHSSSHRTSGNYKSTTERTIDVYSHPEFGHHDESHEFDIEEFQEEEDNTPAASNQLRQMILKQNRTDNTRHEKSKSTTGIPVSVKPDKKDKDDFISKLTSTVRVLKKARKSLSQSHQRARRDASAGHKGKRFGKAKRRGRWRKAGFRCRWVKIVYPVTDDCYCSC